MESAITIGGGPSKEGAKAAEAAIVAILKAGFQSHADQATICNALEAFARSCSANNTTIQNCAFGDKTLEKM